LNNENTIWGDLIPTNVYENDNEKIVYSNFTKKTGFLDLIISLCDINDINYFTRENQKKWFSEKYKFEEDLVNEPNYKNQIYIIYLLKVNKLLGLSEWDWYGDRFNFGRWSHYSNCESFFTHNGIFQMIKTNFAENSQYIFDFHYKKLTSESVFTALQNWSKN